MHCTQRDDRVAGRDLGRWWEGDDWFVIDGERWPPTLHGTGTEDYFNLAYGFHRVDCRPEYGVTFLERPDPALIACGKFSMYRFHLSDPIPFESSIAASLEHGNFNLAPGPLPLGGVLVWPTDRRVIRSGNLPNQERDS